MSKNNERSWNQTRHCMRARRTDGLVKRQAQMCKQNLELMGVVAHATYQAAAVCQELFSDSRWNCSSIVQAPNLLADLTGGKNNQLI